MLKILVDPSEGLTIATLAEVSGLSLSRLKSRFKEETDIFHLMTDPFPACLPRLQ